MSRHWLKCMQFSFCLEVSGLSVFHLIEKSKINLRIVHSYLCKKLLVLSVPASSKSAFSGYGVLTILKPASLAKIADSVVGRVAVYMVKLLFGPNTMNVKPSKSVGVVPFAKYADFYVPKMTDVTCYRPCLHSGPIPAPNEYPGFWIVGYVLTKLKYAKIAFSHDDSLLVRLVRASSVLAHIRGLLILGVSQALVHRYRLVQTALQKPPTP